MKKVIQYLRISTADQSNWSIDGQQRIIETFAERNGMQIIATYIDEGVSAKNFDRPQWKLLEQHIKEDRSIKGIIVAKYDRLIRNVLEALVFLNEYEQKYGLTIYSASENFEMDTSSPMFFKIRTDMLVQAEFERWQIRSRTKMGNWSSKMQGRYINRAPFGYINDRDEYNKPIITIHPDRKPIIEYIFRSYAQGIPAVHIFRSAKKMGFTIQKHGAIQSVIRNITYKGKVQVPEYKGEPAHIIDGIHDPIISAQLWDKCNAILAQRSTRTSSENDQLPLRGLLRCMGCGEIMSGSRSKGRSKYYHYYRCMDCTKVNYNTTKVDADIMAVLGNLQMNTKLMEATRKMTIKKLKKLAGQSAQKRASIRHKISKLHTTIDTLEEKYLTGKIDDTTYQKWNRRHKDSLRILTADLDYYLQDHDYSIATLDKHIPEKLKLDYLYEKVDSTSRYALISHLFQQQIYYSNHTIRTAKLHPAIMTKRPYIKGLEVMNDEKIRELFGESPLSSP